MEEQGIALITGATSGFGEAIARSFAAIGMDVIITGRRQERLDTLKNELETTHDIRVLALCFDVRDKEATEKALTLPEAWQNIKVLVNNAGLAAGRDPIDQGNVEDWDQMVDTNVKGLLYVSRCIIPLLKQQEESHIINISSIAGQETYASGNIYCATKHAVQSISKGMRIDLLPYNIKVTSICPGLAETEFSLVRFKGDEDTAGKVYDGYEPLKAVDIAELVLFAYQRPSHVGINEITVTPTAQANSFYLNKQ